MVVLASQGQLTGLLEQWCTVLVKPLEQCRTAHYPESNFNKKKLFSKLLKEAFIIRYIGAKRQCRHPLQRQGLCQGHCHVCIRE